MATGYGGWVATDDWRSIVEANVANTSNTVCTVTVNGKMQSVYAYGSYWSGNATSAADGSTTSNGQFACGTNQTVTYKTNTFTVSRGTSAKTVTCKATVYGSGGYAGTSSTASVNVTIPAKPSYTVSYNANGGTGAPGNQVKWYDENLKLSTTVPTRSGCTFKGWATSASSSTVSYASGATYTGNAALTLYAVWQYTISYNGNKPSGASANPANIPASQLKTHGVNLTLSSTKPTLGDTTSAQYTVTYNANGGSVSPTSATSTKKISYSFKNWNTAANGSGTAYNAGATFSANATTVLYAQWNSSTTTQAITLPNATRTNYTFNGWYTAATGGTKIGNAGATYTPSANIQLYAQWTLNYQAPTLGNFSVVRCTADGTPDDNGTYAKCSLAWTNGSKAPEKVVFAVVGGSSYTVNIPVSTTISVSTIVGGSLSTEQRYVITATLTDAMPRSYSAQTILTPAFFTLDFLKGGRGVAIGQPATKANILDIALETVLEGKYLRLVSSNLSVDTVPSAETGGDGALSFYDSKGQYFAQIFPVFRNDNDLKLGVNVRRTINGSYRYNSLRLGVDGSGNATVQVVGNNVVPNWRNALNVAGVNDQASQNIVFNPMSTAGQLFGIYANVTNQAETTLKGKRVALIVDSNGIWGYNSSDNKTLWTAMTTIGGTFTGSILLKSTNITSNTAPSTATNGNTAIAFRDNANNTVGYMCMHFGADNIQWLTMYAQRAVSGTAKFSTLRLGVDSSGNARVNLEGTKARQAWNSALRQVLYNNATGTNGNVTLSETAANFNHLTIYYRTKDNFHSSVDVFAPNGKIVSLQSIGVNNAGNNMYLKSRTVTINGTSITKNGEGSANLWSASTGYPGASTDIYITRVEGW